MPNSQPPQKPDLAAFINPAFKAGKTKPKPCPILKGKSQTRIVVERHGILPKPIEAMQRLDQNGYIRTGLNSVFKTACEACQACIPVRTDVEAFLPIHKRSLRKNFNRNSRLTVRLHPDKIDHYEHATLAMRHYVSRFRVTEISHHIMMDQLAYQESALGDPNVSIHLDEYRKPPYSNGEQGDLLAASWYFTTHKGLVPFMFYYDPKLKNMGLGTYTILQNIMTAAEKGLPHVYLGSWTKEQSAYSYKRDFAHEIYAGNGQWKQLEPQNSP